MENQISDAITSGLDKFKMIDDDVYRKMYFFLNHLKINEFLNLDKKLDIEDVIDAKNEIARAVDAVFYGRQNNSVTIYTTNPNTYSMSIIKKMKEEEICYYDKFEYDDVSINIETENGVQSINYYKKFKSENNNYGVIKYQIPFQTVVKCFKELDMEGFELMYVGQKGEIIEIISDGNKYADEQAILNSNKIHQSMKANMIDGTIYALVSDESIKSEILIDMIGVGALVLLMLFLLFVAIVFMLNYLAKGIYVMANCVRTENFHDLDNTRFLNKEMELLKDYFIELREKIVYENNEKYHAVLKSLSNRMSPHFLYNTLGAVRNISDNIQTKEAINLLVKYYRYMFAHTEEFVTVREDVDMIGIYVELLKISYSREFIYKIFVEEELNEKYIPNNIIQPLIENAFIHGINTSGENNNEISLKIENCQNIITISVSNCSDNSHTDLQYINAGILSENSALGVMRKRLDLLCGGKSTVSAESDDGRILVKVQIPCRFDIL